MANEDLNESIKNSIDEAIASGKKHIKLRGGNFWVDLIESVDKQPRQGSMTRIMLFCICIIFVAICVVSIIVGGVFLVKDILLYNRPPVITESGSIVPQRSCNREQVIFFFNTAECWSNTGVYLHKGDKIRISQSGGFHSDLKGVIHSATANEMLKYPYYDSRMTANNYDVTNDPSLQYTLYNNQHSDARFGSVLWQINNENNVRRNPTNAKIHQLDHSNDSKHYIDIDATGEIFFTVNDIYLTPDIIAQYCTQLDTWHEELARMANDDERLNFLKERDLLYYIDENENLVWQSDAVMQYFNNSHMRDIWFKDNIGSIMICIEIVRNAENMAWYAQWYREVENSIFDDINRHSHRFMQFLSALWNSMGAMLILFLQIILLCVWIFSNSLYCDAVSAIWQFHDIFSWIALLLIVWAIAWYNREKFAHLVGKQKKKK